MSDDGRPIDADSKTVTDLRDERGRFLHSPGPGRPKGASSRFGKLIEMMAAATDEDELRQIVRRVVELAKDGDLKAASWVFDRIFGKPRQLIELSGGMEIHQNHPTAMFDELVAEVLRDSPEAAQAYKDLARGDA